MTQAFNLSQLANNVNTSGLLNAAAGLYNATPVANGGTGKTSVSSGTLLLGAGTSVMTELTGGTAGNVVTWNGSAWGSAAGAGGALQTYTVATTPGTWTKPATLKGIIVTVVGGGGNGGASSGPGTLITGAGGGGGGAAIRLYPAPSLPGPQPYTVGGAGATSSFGVAPITVISATGGATGGSGGPAGSQPGGAGGIGSNGNANMAGNGGGAATTSSGHGGGSIYGGGGVGKAISAPGAAGGAYGGGGGGGAKTSVPVSSSGGAGAAGVVIIEEFY